MTRHGKRDASWVGGRVQGCVQVWRKVWMRVLARARYRSKLGTAWGAAGLLHSPTVELSSKESCFVD